MKTYAFIFARGGSKGLPGKNIKNLNGKPLLAYSIEMAKSVEAIEEVFVSSDDEDIKAVALKYKAKVISRPKNLATDNSPEIDSWRHAYSNNFLNIKVCNLMSCLPCTRDCQRSMIPLNSFELVFLAHYRHAIYYCLWHLNMSTF